MKSFRPLGIFWAVVLAFLAIGAAFLQVMGPIKSEKIVARSSSKGADTAALPTAKPASVAPSSAHPAPALQLTGASIPDPDPALLEPSGAFPDRMLPKASGPGHNAAQLYAAAFDPAERHPRVALVLDGAGLDRGLTEQAIRALPLAVDLAFSAYAPPAGAAELAQMARRGGRECLVSIPMEPTGYPMMEEGNRELLVGGVPAQNEQNLDWALSSVAGCVGATGGSDGLNGGRFAESTQAFAEMLATVERRGLLYLDARPDASAPLATAPGRSMPRVVDVIVDRAAGPDQPADAQTIDRNLAELEQDALRRGVAIGLAGPPRPVLLDRITVWAHGLAARGVVLAPLTAIPPPRPAVQETLP